MSSQQASNAEVTSAGDTGRVKALTEHVLETQLDALCEWFEAGHGCQIAGVSRCDWLEKVVRLLDCDWCGVTGFHEIMDWIVNNTEEEHIYFTAWKLKKEPEKPDVGAGPVDRGWLIDGLKRVRGADND